MTWSYHHLVIIIIIITITALFIGSFIARPFRQLGVGVFLLVTLYSGTMTLSTRMEFQLLAFFSLLMTRRFIWLLLCLSLVLALCTFCPVLSDCYIAWVWCSFCVRFVQFYLIVTLLESGASSVYVLSSFIWLLLCLSLVLALCTFCPVLSDCYLAWVWC